MLDVPFHNEHILVRGGSKFLCVLLPGIGGTGETELRVIRL